MTLASSERPNTQPREMPLLCGHTQAAQSGGDIRIFPFMHGTENRSKLGTLQENYCSSAVPLLVVKIMTLHCNKSEQERAQSWKPLHRPSALSLSHTSSKQFVQNGEQLSYLIFEPVLFDAESSHNHSCMLPSFHRFPVKKLDNKEENAHRVKRALFRVLSLLYLKG
jgi:hypothetical protein